LNDNGSFALLPGIDFVIVPDLGHKIFRIYFHPKIVDKFPPEDERKKFVWKLRAIYNLFSTSNWRGYGFKDGDHHCTCP
jgi:hypothetical protein